MDHRVSDLSKAQLCNLFADKIPRMVKRLCGGFGQTLDDRMQSAWTELIQYAQTNQDLTVEVFIPRAMSRVRGAVVLNCAVFHVAENGLFDCAESECVSVGGHFPIGSYLFCTENSDVRPRL